MVFLPECHSTNSVLAELTKKEGVAEGTMVYTDHQSQGRGQRGNHWHDDPGKNVLMSVLLKPTKLRADNQYLLNLVTGLAVLNALDQITDSERHLKWPNDIYLQQKKAGGILIESNLKGNVIESAIIGIGLNLNQQKMEIPNATSVFLQTGRSIVKEEMMEAILLNLEDWYKKLLEGRQTEIMDSYHARLLWRNEIRSFKSAQNVMFRGMIRGIDQNGRLMIEHESGRNQSFDIKEIEFIH